jgi:hypothetical protein
MIFMSWISCGLPHILPHHVYMLWHDYNILVITHFTPWVPDFPIWASNSQIFRAGTVPVHPAIWNGPCGTRWTPGHCGGKSLGNSNSVSMSRMVVEWMEKSYLSTSYTDDFPYCNLWFAIFQVELQFRLRIGWYGSGYGQICGVHIQLTSWVGYYSLASLAWFTLATEI